MENRELHPNLQAALQLVEGIFQMLGSRYEVILHDLSHVESSIVALAGDVTHGFSPASGNGIVSASGRRG